MDAKVQTLDEWSLFEYTTKYRWTVISYIELIKLDITVPGKQCIIVTMQTVKWNQLQNTQLSCYNCTHQTTLQTTLPQDSLLYRFIRPYPLNYRTGCKTAVSIPLGILNKGREQSCSWPLYTEDEHKTTLPETRLEDNFVIFCYISRTTNMQNIPAMDYVKCNPAIRYLKDKTRTRNNTAFSCITQNDRAWQNPATGCLIYIDTNWETRKHRTLPLDE